MRTAYAFLTLLFTAMLHAAVPIGAVRINTDTTGTNTHSSAITVTGQTNLFAGTLNATNSVNVGRPGEAGLVTVLGTNNVAYVAIDPTNTITFGTNIFTYGAQPNTVLSGLRLTGNGDPASTGFYFEEADSLSFTADAWIEGFAYIVGTTNAHSQLDAKAISPSGEADFTVDVLSSATNRVQVQGLFAGKGFTLLPTAGASSTAYTLDTSVSHSAGNLLEIANNSTNKLNITYLGGLQIGDLTPIWEGSDNRVTDYEQLDSGGATSAGFQQYIYTDAANTNGAYAEVISFNNGGGTQQAQFNVNVVGVPLGNGSIGGTVTASVLQFIGGYTGHKGWELIPTNPDGTTPFTFNAIVLQTTNTVMAVQNGATNLVGVVPDMASTNAPLILNINGTQQRVHVGAADSGGTGFRMLRILN